MTLFDSFSLDDFEEGLDEEQVLFIVAKLLYKMRTIVKTVKNGSNILRWARKKQKQHNIRFELLKDYRGRWNYTYLCLKRVLDYYSIVNELTSANIQHEIIGLTKAQARELQLLQLDDMDWTLALALVEVLAPFYLATKCLSIRKCQTFGDGFIYMKFIKSFLSNHYDINNIPQETDDAAGSSTAQNELRRLKTSSTYFYELVNQLKTVLLEAYEVYTSRHLSPKQLDAMLVSGKNLSI